MAGMKHFLIGLLTFGLCLTGLTAASAEEFADEIVDVEEISEVDETDGDFVEGIVEEVPETIYKWVQSTARANYYFNFRQMNYRVDDEGFIDLDVLNVPALFIYDDVQKDDVISKRRWRNQSREGYDTLVGRADYLEFHLNEGTVRVTQRDDLDEQWGVLDTDSSGEPIELSSMSQAGVEYKFYRAIIYYAKRHNDELIKRSRGKLSPVDQQLDESEMPLMKLEMP